jgi:xylulokinase
MSAVAVVAGVDSSTQSTKVELRDVDSGAVVGRVSAPHPATTPPRSEQDPEAWWRAFSSCWAALGSPDVAALAVAGQQHGMVVLDEIGRVIRPAKLWNDTESAPDAAWLVSRLDDGAAGWADACGSVPVASFTVTKLSWLHRSEPEAWARLDRVLLPHDWMTYRLTGRCTTDRGDASGTGYWSPADGGYRWDLLAIVDGERDWTAALPEVLGPLDDAGAWRGAVVAPGTGDNMAAALGLGVNAGDVVVSLGTSGTVYTVSEQPTADAAGLIAGFADATGRFLPLACTLNAMKVTDAIGRLLGTDHAELEELALATAPGAGGVVLLPYLDGERTPNRPAATGVLAGLRSDVTREQLARAAIEGVVCSLLDALDALNALVPTGGAMVLTGGGARSRAYRQILADLSGRAIVVPEVGEAVATGACVQAAAVLHQRPLGEVQHAWGLGRGSLIEPGAAASAAADVRAAYAARREREA